MKVSINDVKYIAKLARLSLTQYQAEKLLHEFEEILFHFETIDHSDLNDVTIDICCEDIRTVLREDEPYIFEDKKKLFRNVKSMRDTYVKVPKIIE